MAKSVRTPPPNRPRPPVAPLPGAGGGNYFAGVVDELRKVVWPTWDELGRMTGVVVTTVIIMAVLISAADYGLGFVVRQLYTTTTTSPSTGSTVSAQPSVAATPAVRTPAPTSTLPTTAPTSSGTSTAPVTP